VRATTPRLIRWVPIRQWRRPGTSTTSSQFEHRTLRGDRNPRLFAESTSQCVKVIVDASLLVVEENDMSDVRVTSQFDGVLRRSVTEVGLRLQLFTRQLRVVNEYIGSSQSDSAAWWYSPNPSGPGPRALGQWSVMYTTVEEPSLTRTP